MNDTKDRMTKETMDVFQLLDWKNETFSHIVLDDTYSLELFLFALALGVESGRETELTKTDTLVRTEYFNTKNEAFLYSVFISELTPDADIEEIGNIGKVYGKVQKYTNTGFKLIDNMFQKSEEIVRLELF